MSNQIETKYLGEIIKKHTQDITGKEVVITGTTSGTGYDVQMQSNETTNLTHRTSKKSNAKNNETQDNDKRIKKFWNVCRPTM